MWIKHNHALYNSNYIVNIYTKGTKLIATFNDGKEEIIGEFKLVKECEDILHSVTRALLFEDPEHPGLTIKDTKKKKEKE